MTTRTRWTKTMSATVAALSAALGMAEGNLDLADAPPEVREKAEFYNQAMEWREKGRLDQALEAFQSLLAGAEPDPCPDCRRLYSGAANNAGLILLQQLEAGRAEFYFRQAVAWDSENALAWNNLGAALLARGGSKRRRRPGSAPVARILFWRSRTTISAVSFSRWGGFNWRGNFC